MMNRLAACAAAVVCSLSLCGTLSAQPAPFDMSPERPASPQALPRLPRPIPVPPDVSATPGARQEEVPA